MRCGWHGRGWTSAANLKFLSVSRQVRDRNFKFKAATQINELLELLWIPKFASEVAAIACELRNRSSGLDRLFHSGRPLESRTGAPVTSVSRAIYRRKEPSTALCA